ncbi:hypothetical protein YTPLAS18_28040 [Nitrospira sp.]|nr:hypothetical protein YTPLAS18_28040 [Nitrospira sp.]
MRHPFESGTSIIWLATLVAVLAGYLFLTLPPGPVVIGEAEAAVQTMNVEHQAQGVAANVKPRQPVPVGGFAIAFAVGVIALFASLGALVGAPMRPKGVRWVGPRSSTF